MPEKNISNVIFILYCIAAVSGGVGGCAVAAHQLIGGKQSIRLSFFLAYAIIGAAFGLLTAAYGAFLVDDHITDIIGPSLIAGAAASIFLSGMNVTARFILKRLGMEIVVTVRRDKEERRKDD